MPFYSYTTLEGRTVERKFRMGKAPRSISMGDGTQAFRDIVADFNGRRAICSTYPFTSDAAGVHPSQVAAARAQSVKDGVPLQFTKDGAAVFESASQRRKYLKSVGLYDRNAGYSDPAPQHYAGQAGRPRTFTSNIMEDG